MSSTVQLNIGEPTSMTLVELASQFGAMPLPRLRWTPIPGTATEDDLFRVFETEDCLCELIDGTLLEKPADFQESQLTAWLIWKLMSFVVPRQLGAVTGPDGPYRLRSGLIRLPDIAFVCQQRLGDEESRQKKTATIAPNLAIEVLSASNTPIEVQSKLKDYFQAGVELVWLINHLKQTCEVYTSLVNRTVLTQGETLTGGTVLPGFELSLHELFTSGNSL